MKLISSVGARILSVLVLTSTLASGALAHDYKAGTLQIAHPWTRATPQGAPVAGGYTAIENTGDQPDRLIGGSFSASSGFSIHQMSNQDGVMKMAPVQGGLEIPAHGKVELSPSSFHLMFTGLEQQLKPNQSIDGTLVFEKAGTVSVKFKVEAIGAKQPAEADHSNH
ncbi:copper chaperone PCu(A)C [Labrys sp. KNU-23]|uniref:copper chaperone PCu(A)C n=1 Tax=Labrys sp. KNU-23 TaxID=2789216 RepID=UPI0011EDDAC3|nr:copper chaperone PCu(A)C [Labrys sp. KNU-23]QEN90785.1 copper chaperone PCu(A)C [Labrys sp. KNU-23]